MGGVSQDCGCYDGPFDPSNPRDVSIRCDEHADVPGDGEPMRRNRAGHAVFLSDYLKSQRPRPAMAIPKSRERRRS